MNIVPRSGGNTTRGSFFVSGTGEDAPVRQPDPGAEESGRHSGEPADQGLRRVRHARRADPGQGSPVVFRERAHRRQHEGERERLLQPERRRSVEVALRAGCQPAANTPTGRSRMPAARVTWQVTPATTDSAPSGTQQQLCRSCTGATPGLSEPQRVSPEAVGVLGQAASRVAGTWSVAAHDSSARRRRLRRDVRSASATSSANRIRRAI